MTNSLVEEVSNFEDVAKQPKHVAKSNPIDGDGGAAPAKPGDTQASDPQSKDEVKMNIVKTDLDLSTGTQRDSHSLVDNVAQFEDVASQPKHVAHEEPEVEEHEPQL